MSARDELHVALRRGGWHRDEADCLIAARDAEVEAKTRRELLGDDCNSSNLVVEAQSYRLLRDAIEKTMTDPDRWDGDTSEVDLLARYVEWLAKRPSRAEVLNEAADRLRDLRNRHQQVGLRPESKGLTDGICLLRALAEDAEAPSEVEHLTQHRLAASAVEAGDGS